MTHRATITLDNDSYAFLNSVAANNRSAYINQLLKQARKDSLKEALIKANEEEAEDAGYQEELKTWDTALSDGLTRD